VIVIVPSESIATVAAYVFAVPVSSLSSASSSVAYGSMSPDGDTYFRIRLDSLSALSFATGQSCPVRMSPKNLSAPDAFNFDPGDPVPNPQ
jgi:hypothetical protein